MTGRSSPRGPAWRDDRVWQAGFLIGSALGAAATVVGRHAERSARRAARLEVGLAESRAALEASKPAEELSRERLHQLRDLTILVRKRKLKPEKGRRKDLRKIDSLIEDLQLLIPKKVQR
jgi:hypothetical protein